MSASEVQSLKVELGQVTTGGNACPQGTVSATLSPDNTALSLIFDNFSAEVESAKRRRSDRARCTISIPVHIPKDVQLSLVGIDYRGYTFVPRGAQSRFMTAHRFRGKGIRQNRAWRTLASFKGEIEKDFTIHEDIRAPKKLLLKACGADVALDLDMIADVQNNKIKRSTDPIDLTILQLDTADAVSYQLEWIKCPPPKPAKKPKKKH